MATTVRLLVKERQKFLRSLKPKFRKVDAAIEAAERELARILKRKSKVPEDEDLIRLLDFSGEIATNLNLVVNELKKGYVQ